MRRMLGTLVVIAIVTSLTIAAPFTEPVARAAECTNSVGPGIPPPTSVPSGVHWYHASWYGQSGYPTLCPGATSTATVAYYNSGSEGWYGGQMFRMAFLGTWKPEPGQDQPSPLGGDGTNGSPATGWPRYNRVAAQPVPYVGPGQVAWFQFTVRAPATPGVYRLYIRPLIEGTSWMEDFGVYWQVVVKTDDTEQAVVVDSVDAANDRFVAGSATFRYDSNDTFRYRGAPVSLAQFESALSRGDTMLMRYDPDAADVSTFDIAYDIGRGAPTISIAQPFQGDPQITITEPESNVDGLQYSLERSSIAELPREGCTAGTGQYAQIATLTVPRGSNMVGYIDRALEQGRLYCYRAGTTNPITGTTAYGYSHGVQFGFSNPP